MGADAVGFGSAAEVALGCRVCFACQKGNCPYGITSQKAEMRARLDPIEGGRRLANFIHACTEEVKILTMLAGHRRIADLSTEDLRAMDLNTAAITGLKLIGYDRPLAMWESYQPGMTLSPNGHGHARPVGRGKKPATRAKKTPVKNR